MTPSPTGSERTGAQSPFDPAFALVLGALLGSVSGGCLGVGAADPSQGGAVTEPARPPAISGGSTVEVDAHSEGCPSEIRPCAHVHLFFPGFTGDSDLDRELRAWTRETLGAYDHASAHTLARRFLADWEEAHRSWPATHRPDWFLERVVERADPFPSLVVLSMFEMSYSGGAHPSTRLRHQVFHAESGERRGSSWWFLPEADPLLRQLLETRFLESRRLVAGSPPTDWDFDWAEAPLDNLALDSAGLVFHFDPYDVAPYAVGPIDVLLRWVDLAPALTEAAAEWVELELEGGCPGE